MLSIISKEKRESKSPLERAAQAFDLAQSIGSIGNSLSGLYETAAKTASGGGSTNPDMFDPKRYKGLMNRAEIMPEQYSTFRVRQ